MHLHISYVLRLLSVLLFTHPCRAVPGPSTAVSQQQRAVT